MYINYFYIFVASFVRYSNASFGCNFGLRSKVTNSNLRLNTATLPLGDNDLYYRASLCVDGECSLKEMEELKNSLHTERLQIYMDRACGYTPLISNQEEIDHYQLEEGLKSQLLQRLTSDGVSLHTLTSGGMVMDQPIATKSHMDQNAGQVLWNVDDTMKDALVMCLAILLVVTVNIAQ